MGKCSTDIPLQRNYLTTLVGNVLTLSSQVDITIVDNFANGVTDEPYYQEIWDGVTVTEPALDAATTRPQRVPHSRSRAAGSGICDQTHIKRKRKNRRRRNPASVLFEEAYFFFFRTAAPNTATTAIATAATAMIQPMVDSSSSGREASTEAIGSVTDSSADSSTDSSTG